jgi:two-component system, cell cycle sensor histidine kinase and response regulator CckA
MSPPPSSEKTILIVDDEESICLVVSEMLKNTGFRVHTASSGPAALELYQKHQKEISLVLLDMTLPGMSGLEIYEKLLKINPNIITLLMSGYAEQQVHEFFAGRPMPTIIQKPFKIPELLQLIESLDPK